MTDSFDDQYNPPDTDNSFLGEYHPAKHTDEDILDRTLSYEVSSIIEEDEPIAVAANNNPDLTIEVYERRPCSLLEKPKKFLGLLEDYLLRIEYNHNESPKTSDNHEFKFLMNGYFGFNESDHEQIEEFLDKFSDNGYNTHIRGKDL